MKLTALLNAMVLVLVFGCNNFPKPGNMEITEEEQHLRDSAIDVAREEVNNRVYGDTTGVSLSPIKVTSARIVESESGSYRNVRLSWKNVSGKKVTAIRFMWYGLNAFGEPADMGNPLAQGFGGGFSDDAIKPGKSDYGTWSILSRDARKITRAWPTEAVFEDGSKWELKN